MLIASILTSKKQATLYHQITEGAGFAAEMNSCIKIQKELWRGNKITNMWTQTGALLIRPLWRRKRVQPFGLNHFTFKKKNNKQTRSCQACLISLWSQRWHYQTVSVQGSKWARQESQGWEGPTATGEWTSLCFNVSDNLKIDTYRM